MPMITTMARKSTTTMMAMAQVGNESVNNNQSFIKVILHSIFGYILYAARDINILDS